MKQRAGTAALAGFVLVAAGALAAGGCYQRVVKREGIGSSGERTYEPNLREGDDRGALDVFGDAIFGPVESEPARR